MSSSDHTENKLNFQTRQNKMQHCNYANYTADGSLDLTVLFIASSRAAATHIFVLLSQIAQLWIH